MPAQEGFGSEPPVELFCSGEIESGAAQYSRAPQLVVGAAPKTVHTHAV
jgi:hypothetical protein